MRIAAVRPRAELVKRYSSGRDGLAISPFVVVSGSLVSVCPRVASRSA
jgi:hypothetical protein